MNKEPTIIIGALLTIINAAVPLAQIFGFIHWTSDQIAAFVAFTGVISTVAGTLFIRSQVVPTAKANEQIQEGIDSPKGSVSVADVIKKVEEKNA
jgi:hypothetical protein